VCSITSRRHTKDYVLMAPADLNADVAGRVSLKADEGLVPGLVGRRKVEQNLSTFESSFQLRSII